MTKSAIFAGGCFWCMQPVFDNTPGVLKTTVGYTGGTTVNPTYEEVITGNTGHVEAIKIDYDESKSSFEALLELFWSNIDPTTENGQFYDIGSQYQTAIFYQDEGEHQEAEASKANLLAKFPRIGTKILPAKAFYPAESYHQGYYKKKPFDYEFYHESSGRDEKLKKLWKR